MAEMCSRCSIHHGFGIDIDIKSEFLPLKEGFEINVLCEGCALLSIGKTLTGKCILYFGEFCPNPNLRGRWWYYDLDTDTIEGEYIVLDNKPEN